MRSQITFVKAYQNTYALILAFAATQALAQPAFLPPQADFGGHLVEEMLPYQPEIYYSIATQDRAPLYLDTCPEFCNANDVYAVKPVSQTPPGVRDGLFQKLFFTGTWIPRLDDDSLGISELETGIVFGLPFFRKNTPLLITPRFAVHYLDGPSSPDLPARVFDAEISFRHLRKFGNGPWAMDATVTLGHYSDFESSDADAFRVTGRALAVYESTPTTQWVFGVVYLNRRDVSVVPVVGMISKPTPDIKYEAILPRPRLAWRLPDGERWAYLAGEFGGGIWSIERPPTLTTPAFTQDLLTYNDYRILLGIERKVAGGLSRRVEVGYVFGRELDFSNATSTVRLDDSLFVRGGLTY